MQTIELKVVGKLSKKLFDKFNDSLITKGLEFNELILFCDYSDFDIPIGHCFQSVREPDKQSPFYCNIILKKISEEFGISLELIPKGYKTICKFKFIDKNIPEIIKNIPEIIDWYESGTKLILR